MIAFPWPFEMGPSNLPTPVLTHHCRARCLEMGIRTKRVKRLIRHADMTYPGNPATHNGAHVAVSNVEPELAAVFVIDEGVPVVLTVLWRGVAFVRP